MDNRPEYPPRAAFVDMLKIIKKEAKANPVLKQYANSVNAAHVRFQAQNLFFRYPKLTDLKRMIRSVAVLRSR